jgi:AraC family transcriptional activator of tynA and feaB
MDMEKRFARRFRCKAVSDRVRKLDFFATQTPYGMITRLAQKRRRIGGEVAKSNAISALASTELKNPTACDLGGAGRAWSALLSATFVELEFEHLGDDIGQPVSGKIFEYPFGDLTFQRSVTSGRAHRVTRSERLIRASTHNNFFIGFLLSGGVTLRQDGHTAALQTGDIAILDSTRVYSIDVPRGFDALWVRTPRHRLEGRLRNVSDIMASKIDGHVGVGHVASEMLRAALVEAPRLYAPEANRVANNLLDLLGIALSRSPQVSASTPTSRSAAMLRRVQESIDSRLDDETLSPAAIALANRVSVRYMNKLFRREGLSLARWIRRRRLERCRGDLEDPASSERQISDIAYSHGFKNISHFNRLFRSQFGSAPGAFRQRA